MNDPWYSNPTQVYFACRALALGKTLNHMDVIMGVRGWRLGAIVHTLRVIYGWPIVTEFCGPERIGHYRLNPTCDPTELDFPPSARRLVEELAALRQDIPGTGNSGAGCAHG
ncbi:hypothetical protein [Aliiruegeria lutimaris]|uniref:Uncharacterized protein n=1 Tax=Aliiruegeria lutimaris TaxID=571298 RepID=A0A1G8VCU2_9RHOB|nr:hypothetical protein [Aliiruegeria lutimaris]SDJ63833.1 hypothetical protein SAMN04488026_10219 [Aliiruegeria lutimaris]